MTALIPAHYRQLLRLPSYRTFWIGASLSATGDTMNEVGILWVASELEPEQAGMAIALSSIAYIVPGVLTGALLGRRLDGIDCRTLMLVDAFLRLTMMGTAAALHWLDRLTLPVFLVLLALGAMTKPLDTAGRYVFLRRLVPENQLFAANTLLATVVMGSAIFGPALSGLLITGVGTAAVLAVDALSFALFGLFLLNLPIAEPEKPSSTTPHLEPAPLTGRQLLQLPTIVLIFVVTFFFYLLYGPMVVALPLWTQGMGENGAQILGWLYTGFGVGALMGVFWAGSRPQLARSGVAIFIVLGWGAAATIVGLTPSIPIAIVALAVGGFAYAPYPSLMATILQREAPPGTLARLSSYWAAMGAAAVPIGTLLGGITADLIPPQPMIFLSGFITIILACLAWLWLYLTR